MSSNDDQLDQVKMNFDTTSSIYYKKQYILIIQISYLSYLFIDIITSDVTSPCTTHANSTSYPSLACTHDFSTVISGGAINIYK